MPDTAASHSEFQTQLEGWLAQYGGTEADVAALLCDRWAAEPSRLALNYENGFSYHESLSYSELEDKSRRFAAALRAQGIGKGDRVAVLLPKRPAGAVRPLWTDRDGHGSGQPSPPRPQAHSQTRLHGSGHARIHSSSVGCRRPRSAHRYRRTVGFQAPGVAAAILSSCWK